MQGRIEILALSSGIRVAIESTNGFDESHVIETETLEFSRSLLPAVKPHATLEPRTRCIRMQKRELTTCK
jgi:hypothetical protein